MPQAPYIGSGLPSKIVSTDGIITLFQIAAKELGDPLNWWRIAELNGLDDPWVPAMDGLKIPQRIKGNNDGLPYQ